MEKAPPWTVGLGTNSYLGLLQKTLLSTSSVCCRTFLPCGPAVCVSGNQLIWREHRMALYNYSQHRLSSVWFALGQVLQSNLCAIFHKVGAEEMLSLAEKAFWGKGTDHMKETGAKCLAVECRQTRLAVWVWTEANCPLQWIGAFAICAGHGLAKARLLWWNLVQTLYFTETRKTKPSLKKEPVVCMLSLQTSQLKKKHDSIYS